MFSQINTSRNQTHASFPKSLEDKVIKLESATNFDANQKLIHLPLLHTNPLYSVRSGCIINDDDVFSSTFMIHRGLEDQKRLIWRKRRWPMSCSAAENASVFTPWHWHSHIPDIVAWIQQYSFSIPQTYLTNVLIRQCLTVTTALHRCVARLESKCEHCGTTKFSVQLKTTWTLTRTTQSNRNWGKSFCANKIYHNVKLFILWWCQHTIQMENRWDSNQFNNNSKKKGKQGSNDENIIFYTKYCGYRFTLPFRQTPWNKEKSYHI